MPTAKLSDIIKPTEQSATISSPEQGKDVAPSDDSPAKATISDSERRITGTADIPLNSAGRKQSIALAKRCKGFFDEVYTSSMERAKATADLIDPKAEVESALDPFKLAKHEGKPVASERVEINERVKNRPEEVAPGRSAISGKRGESFEQFADRGIEWAEKLRERCDEDPELKILNVTHGRNMRLINAWALAGFPKDRTVDTAEMTRDGDDWSKPGDLFILTENGLRLVPGKPKGDGGTWYARHGETNYSKSQPTEEEAKGGRLNSANKTVVEPSPSQSTAPQAELQSQPDTASIQ